MLRKFRGRQGRIRLARKKFVEYLERRGPIDEILQRYDAGEFRGTILEVEIQCRRYIYDDYNEDGTER